MEKKKILIFLAFCFGISWLSAGIFYLCRIDYQSVWGFLFATVYMFFPLVSVLLTQLVTGEKPLSDIGISFRLNKWWWLGWLVIIPLPILISIPVSALFPGVSIGADTDSLKQTMDAMQAQGLSLGPWGVGLITLLSGFVAGLTINAFFAFGEESAWRGFLHRLLKGKGFWNLRRAIYILTKDNPYKVLCLPQMFWYRLCFLSQYGKARRSDILNLYYSYLPKEAARGK